MLHINRKKKEKNTHATGTAPKSNIKIIETEVSIFITHMYCLVQKQVTVLNY
jgi:hypothetical protein